MGKVNAEFGDIAGFTEFDFGGIIDISDPFRKGVYVFVNNWTPMHLKRRTRPSGIVIWRARNALLKEKNDAPPFKRMNTLTL